MISLHLSGINPIEHTFPNPLLRLTPIIIIIHHVEIKLKREKFSSMRQSLFYTKNSPEKFKEINKISIEIRLELPINLCAFSSPLNE